jgi:two-component system, NarL family, sensor histidine kinase DegS
LTEPTDLAGRLAEDVARLDRELAELGLLSSQAATEGARHDQRRAAAADRVAALQSSAATDATEALEASAGLLALTRRASLMEAQIEVLEGKRKVLQRFRDALASYADDLQQVAAEGVENGRGDSHEDDAASAVDRGAVPDVGSEAAEFEPEEAPAVSRIVLAAQEELRREIARAMHDGPAQSLTNIVLQAQIVQRLIDRDPRSAGAELAELILMVQKTLDATQSFIFDVRPMVLDDLGLVPTLRRAARDRGRRAGKAVEFESLGSDRRLPTELESGLFRIIDDALAAYLAAGAERVALSLDWSNPIGARVIAWQAEGPSASPATRSGSRPREARQDLPPLLAAMMAEPEESFATHDLVPEVASAAMPVEAWREIEVRAATLRIIAELSDDRRELRMAIEVPADPPPRGFDGVGPSSY